MKLKFISVLVGAIALAATTNIALSRAESMGSAESEQCSITAWAANQFKGINFTPKQQTQVKQLEAQYAKYKADFERFDALFDNLTEEQEARLEQLEQDYDRNLQTILTPKQWQAWEDDEEEEALKLTPQQEQQIEQLDRRFDAQLAKLVPGWTPEKEEQLAEVEIAYEEQLQSILSSEQYRKWEQNTEMFEAECWEE